MSSEGNVYFIFNDGSVWVDIPPDEIQFKSDEIIIGGLDAAELDYDDIYAIGIIYEDGCFVLWKEEEKHDDNYGNRYLKLLRAFQDCMDEHPINQDSILDEFYEEKYFELKRMEGIEY